MAAVGLASLDTRHFGTYDRLTWSWTSDASGDVSGHATPRAFTGKVVRVITVPAAAADAPTDNYDVTILDQNGLDVLGGTGANRDTAATEEVLEASLGIPVIVDSLDPVIANAGNAKKGTLILYLHRD